jgi:formylglycine-generating enzyme required for sulfatase activity
MRRALLALSLLATFSSPADAVARSCVPGGSEGTPHAFNAPGTWSPAATPTAADALSLSAACIVECPYAATCSSASITVRHAAAKLRVQEGATLLIADMDDFDDPGWATAGTIELSGAKLYDTAVSGPLWRSGIHNASSAALMQMGTNAPATWRTPGPAVPAAGDRILVTSGVGTGLWYQITAVNFSACPAPGPTCSITFRVYDAAMAYANVGGAGQGVGAAHDTSRRAVNVYTGDGAATGIRGERARVASPFDPNYSTATAPNGAPTPFDRCVDLCRSDGQAGWAGNCSNSTVLAENGSYVGWILEFHSSASTPGGGSSVVERHLITSSFDDVDCGAEDCVSGSTGGRVDRVCSDSVFGAAIPSGNAPVLRNVAIIPPIHSGVDFQIWKPAVVRNTGAENDAVLSLSGSAALVASGGFFDDIAVLETSSSGAFDLDATLFTPASTGNGTSGTQSDCTDGRTVRVLSDFTGFYDLDWVAVQDARVPIDDSTLCCRDADADGDCDAGGPRDGEPTSGYHGFQLKVAPLPGTVLTHLGCRYMTDDCLFSDPVSGGGTVAIDGITIWQGGVGASTEGVEIEADASSELLLRVSNLVAINSNGAGDGALNSASAGAPYTVVADGVYSNQSVTSGTVALTAVSAPRTAGPASSATDVIALSAIPTPNTFYAAALPRLSRVYVRNLGKIVGAGWVDASGLFASLASAGEPAIGEVRAGAAAQLHDFVLVDTDVANLTPSDPGGGATLEVYDGYIQLTTQGVTNAIANFIEGSIRLGSRGIDGVIVYNGRVLACGGASWGAANGARILDTTAIQPGTAEAIGKLAANCAAARAPRLLSTWTLNQAVHPFAFGFSPSDFGPRAAVGVPQDAPIMDRVFAGLVRPSYSANAASPTLASSDGALQRALLPSWNVAARAAPAPGTGVASGGMGVPARLRGAAPHPRRKLVPEPLAPTERRLASPEAAVGFDWVPIGDAGNPPDAAGNCIAAGCGSVGRAYRISRYEVTNAQYAAFLNAAAATDPHALYSVDMDAGALGGITRTGAWGSYRYTVKHGLENEPVSLVSFYDALRFANWLHNGQGSGDTESGAYTLLGGAAIPSNGLIVRRNPGARVFLPSENEWYKAAYYDPARPGYDRYPSGADAPTTCEAPGAIPNAAACDGFAPEAVGSYTASASRLGTFDQGGSVWEWNEQIVEGSRRGVRGGSWDTGAGELAASRASSADPSAESQDLGFRVARLVPEPGKALLVLTGGLVLALVERQRRGQPLAADLPAEGRVSAA